MVKSLSQLYLDERKQLIAGGETRQEAGTVSRMLLCHFSGRTLESVLADRDAEVSDEVFSAMDSAVKRYIRGEPLAYILGEWDFYGLPLAINSSVLIPRDDTCAVTSLAVKQALFLGQNPRILDLCTGSGCIGIAIANRVKDARITLGDVSREALAVAKKNVNTNKMTGRVSCVQVDALKPAPTFLGQFDLIVSNPPYVTEEEMKELPAGVKDYEPHLALYGGCDGLDFYRSICSNFRAALKPGGYLCFEFGMDQGDSVCRILRENGFTVLERVKDFNGRERAVMARYIRKDW